MEYLSISFYHIQVPSSVFYSFESIGILPPWLSSSLGILLFLMQLIFFFFFCFILLIVHFYNVQKSNRLLYINFVCCNFTEFIYSSESFLVETLRFLCVVYHLKRVTVLFLMSYFTSSCLSLNYLLKL